MYVNGYLYWSCQFFARISEEYNNPQWMHSSICTNIRMKQTTNQEGKTNAWTTQSYTEHMKY